jgi:membrane protein implicated in regulation of membrane protease activity
MLLVLGLAGLFLLPEPWSVVAVCAAALIEVAEVWFWITFLRRYRVQTGAEGMIGERGQALEAVDAASGRVQVFGEIWRARSPGAAVGAGERVRVVAVEGLTLEVAPEDAGTVAPEPEGTAPPGTEKGP